MNKKYLNLKFDAVTDAGGAAAVKTVEVPVAPAPGATTPPPGVPASVVPPGGWYESFKNEEIKNFVKTREFKDSEMLAESYFNLEKLKGVPADRLLKLPSEPDSPEWKEIYERLGTPKTADEYKIDPVAEDPNSAEFVKWAKDTFHKQNLTTKQAEAVVTEFNNYAKGLQEKQAGIVKQTAEQATSELKAKWGNAFDQNKRIADLAAEHLGIEPGVVAALGVSMGPAKTVEFLHKLGSSIGEAKFIDGQAGGGTKPMAPDVAKSHIAVKRADTGFMKKYLAGDKAAVAEMNRLHIDAYPGSN